MNHAKERLTDKMPPKISSLFTARVQKLEKSRLFKRFGKKTWWGIALVLILAVGGGVTYFQMNATKKQTTTTKTMQTTVARKGDLVIYASGTGTLVALNEANLGFKTSGQVKEINVKVGDLVSNGDVLAAIDDASAQVKYTQAKRALLELTSTSAIATAQEEIATAQNGVQTAINQLAYLISPTVYYWETEIDKADQNVIKTKKALEESPTDTELQKKVSDAEAYLDFAKDKLKGNWYYYDHEYLKETFTVYDKKTGKQYIAEPTDADIAEARAAVTKAKATLKEAEYYYDALTGEDIPEDATGSGLTTLEQAKLDLQSAQLELDGTKIIAPINGTVMSISTAVGDTAGTTSVITLADLRQQYLEVFLDASDWANIHTSYPAEVVFDILPDSAFNGTVTQVDPGLYTESNSSVVRAIVQLTDVDNKTFNLPLGTSAAVDVIGGEATDAILIPIEALHDAGNGQYGVFVMTNGEPRLQLVEIGIQDTTSVEITSGLNPGDVVTTGIAETK
jgi:HlyD family secretion protein